MHTIFQFINDILFRKKGDLLNNVDFESGYNSYMINRWCSMYSPEISHMINYTTNRLYPIFETKQESYKFISSILPKCKFRRINYIKKVKKNTNEDDVIGLLAKNLELSKREINYYITSNNIDIKELKKICQ